MNDLIMATYAGSHLYGLNTKESDIDIRGVSFNPVSSLLGLTGFEQYYPNKEEAIRVSSSLFNVKSNDFVIYGLNKFFKLCLDGNPNMIELLFSENLLYFDCNWSHITQNKDVFLSTKIVHTFSGYAYSQLSRIKAHAKWLSAPPEKPNPFDYGMIQKKDGGQDWLSSNQKNNYGNKLKEYQDYKSWLNNRNPYRHSLEKKYGYDTKHAMHLFRLLIEAKELLLTGNLTLPLKEEDKKFLFNVKNGGLKFEEVLKAGEEAKDNLLELEKISVLPKHPNRKTAEVILIEINKEHLFSCL